LKPTACHDSLPVLKPLKDKLVVPLCQAICGLLATQESSPATAFGSRYRNEERQ
jgi:hypothetical protein